MKIEQFWYEISLKFKNFNQTNSEIPENKFLHLWKILLRNPFATGFLTGFCMVVVIIVFWYVFFLLIRFVVKKYFARSSKDIQIKPKFWNPQDKGPVILKWKYPEETELLESESDDLKDLSIDTKKHRILDIRHKGIVQSKHDKPKPIKEVVIEATIPLNSSSSVGGRRLTGEEWRRAFLKSP